MYDRMMDLLDALRSGTGVTVALLLYVLTAIAWWKIFEKAGEDGWKALIPFYNIAVFVKIVDENALKALLLLIPIVGEIYAILLQFRLAKVFGKGLAFGFGLLFLNTIFTYILAFGDAHYAPGAG